MAPMIFRHCQGARSKGNDGSLGSRDISPRCRCVSPGCRHILPRSHDTSSICRYTSPGGNDILPRCRYLSSGCRRIRPGYRRGSSGCCHSFPCARVGIRPHPGRRDSSRLTGGIIRATMPMSIPEGNRIIPSEASPRTNEP